MLSCIFSSLKVRYPGRVVEITMCCVRVCARVRLTQLVVIISTHQYETKLQDFLGNSDFHTSTTDPATTFQTQIRSTIKQSLKAPPDRREIFAANFVVDWNVHGDKWQSPHWREKIAQASAKLQRLIHCRCLHGFLSLSPR